MMKKQVILYILARAVQVITTALVCNITAMLFMDVAFQERGYLAVGGEWIVIAGLTVTVWYLMGLLLREWYKGTLAMLRLRKEQKMTDLERLAEEATDHGMSYGEYVAWKARATKLSNSKTIAGQGRWRGCTEREGRNERSFS